MTKREAHSFCRICAGLCGVRVTVEDDRVVEVRGDKDHPMSRGYACIKGLKADVEGQERRLLHPQRRLKNGSFERVRLEDALDEIGAALNRIIAEDGPHAVGAYRGTPAYFECAAYHMLPAFLQAIGSRSYYSSFTIDQSAKAITALRMGSWAAGRPSFRDADLWIIVGGNPLVSLGLTLGSFPTNPLKEIKAAKARGLKLVIVDPRRTETAAFADLHIQPKPGEDPTFAAGLIHIILKEGWHDRAFCDRYVEGLDALRNAVAPFTPSYVAARAGVAEDQLVALARMFAVESRNGVIRSGTGPSFAPRSNLADHLYESLNVICGRFLKAGDVVWGKQLLAPPRAPRAEVIGPQRTWEQGPRSRVGGHGTILGEMMSGAIADEILTPGQGRLRAMIISGGNPVAALPDSRKAARAFASLDMLVAIDPFINATSSLAHFILPPTTQYEHPELSPSHLVNFPTPFAQYTPAIAPPPAGSELTSDWYPFWALAKRLGAAIRFQGVDLDMGVAPTKDQLLEIIARPAQVSFDELRAAPRGLAVDLPELRVLPGESDARFEIAPVDVLAEIEEVRAEGATPPPPFTHRLTSRRMRGVMNSNFQALPTIRERDPLNPAFLSVADMAELGVKEGDWVEITSRAGAIRATVKPDSGLRPGVVSMSHAWGRVEPQAGRNEPEGALTNLLVSSTDDVEAINAMPAFSAIPVRLRVLSQADGA